VNGPELPGPNHSAQTRRSVQYDGTANSVPKRSRTYWQTNRCLVAMLIWDRCSDSARTAKIASRTGSLTVPAAGPQPMPVDAAQ
jgi:hypothetical protein